MTDETREYVTQCMLFSGTVCGFISSLIAIFTRSKWLLIVMGVLLVGLVWATRLAFGIAYGLGWTSAPDWHQQAAMFSSLAVFTVTVLALLMQKLVVNAKIRHGANMPADSTAFRRESP